MSFFAASRTVPDVRCFEPVSGILFRFLFVGSIVLRRVAKR